MDALTASIGAAGESLAAATSGSKATTGTRTRYGTVAANNGTTLDVTLSGGTLAALPMTADCLEATVGDRVAVSVDGPLATVTGVIATSDTGGYDIFAGTKVINTSSSTVLFTDAEFKAAFGRSFNYVTDCIIGMNGDSATQSGKTCDLSYSPGNKNIWLEGVGSVGNYRVNYILAMPSGSTRTVAQGVASATSRATSAAEAANEAAKAAQEAASGVTEATDKANAAAESATTAAGKVDAAISEATTAATKATDAAAGAESAATSATSATAAAEKVNATLDGTKLTVTSRDGSTATVDTKGERGETGATGAQGAKGDKGDKGDTGDTGATGAKGDKGDKGDTGAKGADGAGARWNLARGSLNWTGSTWANLDSWADEGTETIDGTPYSVRSKSGTWGGIGTTTAYAAGTYTLSLYAKAEDASAAVWFCNTKAGQATSTGTLNSGSAKLTTEWQRLTWTFTASESFDRPRLEKTKASDYKVYVAGYKLEQASAATDYRPAIADISDATEAEYDRQVARGTYAGRSIQTILGCSSWADTYAALHAKVSAADFSGLRVGDYMDVTFTATDLITTATQRFVLAHFDPYYNTGATALTSHHLAFVAQKAVTVASGVTGYVNGGRIQWNTTATNNGTSSQPAPYIASNLHAFESKLAAELPSSISEYVISRTARLETRYSASGTLTDSNGDGWYDMGKVWSMSEAEAFGHVSFGTRALSDAGDDPHLDLMRASSRERRDTWWTRTPSSGSKTGIVCTGSDGRITSFSAEQTWHYPRPCFLFA